MPPKLQPAHGASLTLATSPSATVDELVTQLAAVTGMNAAEQQLSVGAVPLINRTQTLSADGQFTYLGGSLPLANSLATRATRIACRAVAACGEMHGYVGVDLILGSRADEDCVIEINPRLTSSYLLLRRVADENLARSILAWRQGTGTPPTFSNRHVEFSLPLYREVIV